MSPPPASCTPADASESRRLGPRPTRNLEPRRGALEVLADLGRVRLVENGQAIVVRVNPALLGEERP